MKPEDIAASLSEAQQALVIGDYDPEFARIDDAAALERAGLWSFDASKQDPESDFYELDVTPLGEEVRSHLLKERGE